MKKLLVIGAGLLQSYVIKRAKELGLYVLAIDRDPHAIGFQYADEYEIIDIINKKESLSYAQRHRIDGVLTAASDYGVLTTSYIAQKMNLPGLDYAVARVVKDKNVIRSLLVHHQIDDIKQHYEICRTEDIHRIKREIIYPIIVKPCDASGSRGITRVDNENDLHEACSFAIANSLTHKALIESFIKGMEFGVESFVHKGAIHVLGILKKDMALPPVYAELGHRMPSGLSQSMEEKIKIIVTNAIETIGINFGSVNMDILISDDNKISIIDIGARMGGNLIGSHIIPLATGIDYMGNIIKAAIDDDIDWNKSGERVIATSILALTPGIIKSIPDFKKMMSHDVLDYVFIKNIGEEISFYTNNLCGCGYIIWTGDTPLSAHESAFHLKDIIDKSIDRYV